jgi:hypothetical protein
MRNTTIFVSHVSEEAPLAKLLQENLSRDFLGIIDVFVSSDLDSIAAGENWLESVDEALRNATALLVLCSRASIQRPWVNFEVGAAWIKRVPIIPICHSGLGLRDLPIPFSVLQGVQANDPTGLRRLYVAISDVLKCNVPERNLATLAEEIGQFEKSYSPRLTTAFGGEMQRLNAARQRVYEALADTEHKWRTVERLAILGGITQDEVLEMLVRDQDVDF